MIKHLLPSRCSLTVNRTKRSLIPALILVLFAAVFDGAGPSSSKAQGVDGEIGRVEKITKAPEVSAPPKEASEVLKRPSQWGEPTFVQILVYVIDVDEISSANQNFSASVYYEARWSAPLLRHDGPGPKILGMTEVWTPRLVIVNQQQSWSAYPAYVEISPDGEVVMRQKVWGWFSQPLDLRDFPKDRQTLTIHIAAAGVLESDVRLTALQKSGGRQSSIHKSFSLPDFEVISWKAQPRSYVPFEGELGAAGYALDIQVGRKPSYYIWKVIFPLCLIVMMSWIPRWLELKDSGTSIGISTTAFLTLVAYLFAITVLLPKVSYLTRMDVFILLSTLMVFLGLLQTVIVTYQVNHANVGLAQRVNKWSRAAYPLLLATVLVVSFA